MLSVGKLAQGQERYYERQVAHGRDDYYSGKGEAPGEWIGRGAERLGLEGRVSADQLGALAAGIDPSDVDLQRPLRASRSEIKVAGYDLTFSAPKSVSVLYAVADEGTSAELVKAHDAAVRAALTYVEDAAVKVRRGKGGAVVQSGEGLLAAAYRHRLSRALDPQLHTHVVAANASQGPDGRWTALDARHIYRHAKTAGTLYQAHLRAEVRDRLGLEWGPVAKGSAELVGVAKGVRDHFSRRRMEMLEQAEGDGFALNTKGRAESAALATRERKTYDIDTVTWREEVVARAAEHGLDRLAIEALIDEGRLRRGRGEEVGGPAPDVAEVSDRLAGPQGLTAMSNTFLARDAVREFAEAHRQGARVGDIREQAQTFLGRDDVHDVVLSGELDLPGEQDRLFTTADLVASEKRLVAAATGRAGEGVGRLSESRVERALATADRTLGPEQEAAVRGVIRSGNGVDVIEALAGTGKTYTAGVLCHAYESSGRRVIGVAPTGRAVRELADEAGIVGSRTLHRLLAEVERNPRAKLADIVLLDEAAMASTRHTERLMQWASSTGTKVIAIGDPGQLPSVQAGGWMRAVGERVGRHFLEEVRRQRDPDERRALGQLHEGHSRPYLAWAERAGRVVVHDQAGPALDRVVESWSSAVEDHGLREVVLIARDNETRQLLNDRARQVRRGLGGLGEDHDYGPATVAIGDRIICRRNDALVDVDNGTRGTVLATHEDGVTIRTDSGTERGLPARYVAEHVEPAYALTGHGMQGGTVEWAAVVGEPWDFTRGWSYTALSRARSTTELHVVAAHDTDDPDRDEFAPHYRPPRPTRAEVLDQVAHRMTIRDDEDLAIDRLRDGGRDAATVSPRATQDSGPPQERGADAHDQPITPDRRRLIDLLEERSQIDRRRATLPLDGLRAFEDEAHRLDRAHARRDEIAERLDALPEPRRRLLGIRDDHADLRGRLTADLASADDRVQTLTARVEVMRDAVGGDPGAVQDEATALQERWGPVRKESERLLDHLASLEVRDEPAWATELLGPRPTDPNLRDEWDGAAWTVARHELRFRPDAPVEGLSRPSSGDEVEARRWRSVQAGVHQTRDALEREPGPDISPGIGR
ncbi:MobF family relaxase [Patulibacter sp. NPDC049589]|uniref:MobF family relaxase n=1 Tax=Patulibacter sp. NPDC049589 TaxID=3154731 RepID=UPI00341D8020